MNSYLLKIEYLDFINLKPEGATYAQSTALSGNRNGRTTDLH